MRVSINSARAILPINHISVLHGFELLTLL